MKQKILIIAGMLVVLSCVAFFCFKEDSFSDKIKKINETMESYQLKGNMEILKGEDQKSYTVEVAYKKSDKNDMFRVSITDKALNQTQVILRNKEGVFVLTPALNQIFKFEGDWPLNSLKPYLIQSMHEILKNESCSVKKEENYFLAESDVNYPNNANFKKQEMRFDKDGKIFEISIKDDNDIEQLHLSFQDVVYNASLKDDYFDVPEDLKSEVGASFVLEEQMPLYPMQIYGAKLISAKNLELASGTKHVLTYEGDKSFTVIESLCKPSVQTETVIMGAELLDSIDAFGFYDGNHMQIIQNGIEYTIYSDDLSLEEMSYVLGSMQVVVMK